MRSLIIVFAFLVFSSSSLLAQKRANNSTHQHTLYAELAGQSLGFSFNYDFRFKDQQQGWGARAGLGLVVYGGTEFISVPVGINYISGRNGKYFELGAGATMGKGIFFHSNDFGVVGTFCVGFRVQPEDGGFNFRANLNPSFGSNDDGVFFVPFVPGISLGYTFM